MSWPHACCGACQVPPECPCQARRQHRRRQRRAAPSAWPQRRWQSGRRGPCTAERTQARAPTAPEFAGVRVPLAAVVVVAESVLAADGLFDTRIQSCAHSDLVQAARQQGRTISACAWHASAAPMPLPPAPLGSFQYAKSCTNMASAPAGELATARAPMWHLPDERATSRPGGMIPSQARRWVRPMRSTLTAPDNTIRPGQACSLGLECRPLLKINAVATT